MTDPTPAAKPPPLRRRILAYIVSNGDGTAEGIARAFNLSPEEVDRSLQELAAKHEIYRVAEDLDGLTFGLSIRWQGRYVIPGEFIDAARPLRGIAVITLHSRPTGTALDDRTDGHPVGHMVEVRGVLHPRIFASAEQAVVTAIALQHVDAPEADWAASAFFRIIGSVSRSYPADPE